MIPRYSRPEMTAIWEPESRFRLWLEIETAAAEAMAAIGQIPVEAAAAIRTRGNFDAVRIAEIEAEVKHDVIAFLTSVAEHVGDEARFMHQGMTSSDVLDTAFSLQLVQAADLLIGGVEAVMAALQRRALEYKHVPAIGRSHGIHAEPTTFGLKLAGPLRRLRPRPRPASGGARRGRGSAPSRVRSAPSPRVDPRDGGACGGRNAGPGGGAGLDAGDPARPPRLVFRGAWAWWRARSLENLATEVRHLQRSEVREAEEYFSPGQKGSSAMPHKRNPILSENLTGLVAHRARRGQSPAMENIDAVARARYLALLGRAGVRDRMPPSRWTSRWTAAAGLIERHGDLPRRHGRGTSNFLRRPGLFSQRVLLALTQAGMSREDAYRAVQRNAAKVWDEPAPHGVQPAFLTHLQQDAQISALINPYALAELFDIAWYTRHVDLIFDRVFAEGS